jgi:hypothetical protein
MPCPLPGGNISTKRGFNIFFLFGKIYLIYRRYCCIKGPILFYIPIIDQKPNQASMKSNNSTLQFSGIFLRFTAGIYHPKHFITVLTAIFLFISLASFGGEIKYTTVPNTVSSPSAGTESIRANLYLLNANNTVILADSPAMDPFWQLKEGRSLPRPIPCFLNYGEQPGEITR